MAATEPLAGVRDLFPGAPGYLDTATMGLPPEGAVGEMLGALEAWRTGQASAPGFDGWVARGRAAFARLVGVPEEQVAVGSQVSASAGIVAASLQDRAEVLCVEGDFSSVLFPFLVQRERGVTVRTVALERLADEVRSSTDLVAVSAVQSADGRVADLEALADAAQVHDAATFIDATQACGWLGFDAGRFDYLACSAYKWLLSPRGSSFFAVRPERLEELTPHLAGWYAGEERWSSLYGEPLRLAAGARRLDVSPAWVSWVGAAPAVELLADIGADTLGAHGVRLANLLRDALGLAPQPSPILSLNAPRARERLERAGVKASVRGQAVRVCFHLYNSDEDVDAVMAALA